MSRSLLQVLFSCLWLAMLYTSAVFGQFAQYNVDTTIDDPTRDACIALPALIDCSLRGALRRADSDGVNSRIIIPDGLYRLTADGTEDQSGLVLDLDYSEPGTKLELLAGDGAHPVIEQTLAARVLEIHGDADDVLIRGPLTLRYGGEDAIDQAGGVLKIHPVPNIEVNGVTMMDGNTTSKGGCLDATTGATVDWNWTGVRVLGCISGTSGGGAWLSVSGDSSFRGTDFEIRNNQAYSAGGGVFVQGSSSSAMFLQSSIVRGNTAGHGVAAPGLGGGVFVDSGPTFISSSEISDNQAGQPGSPGGFGGGLAVDCCDLATVVNSTVSGNRLRGAVNSGIGIYAAGITWLRGLSLVEPESDGTTLETALGYGGSAEVEIAASIVDGGCYGTGLLSVSSSNTEVPPPGGSVLTSCDFLFNGGQIVTDAGLLPLAKYGSVRRTHKPKADSPVLSFVSSGDCQSLLNLQDQRGAIRGSFCDGGAHELDPALPPPQSPIFSDGFETGNISAWQ